MPRYRVHRLREAQRESFRWAAHTGGLALVKPKDYVIGEGSEARNPYELWKLMLADSCPLRPGDVIEDMTLADVAAGVTGALRIAKYIGFENAEWLVPELKNSESLPAGSDQSHPADQHGELGRIQV